MMTDMASADSILGRLKQTQDAKDWAGMSQVLEEAGEDDAKDLESVIPDLAGHDKWLIRASTVEMIGNLGLRQLLESVKDRLKDNHAVVRAFALMAYHDLLGTKALPAIEEFCKSENVGLRFTALALHYAETGQEESLNGFSRIIESRDRHSETDHTVRNIFDRYLDI